MTPEERQLLIQTHRMTEENNKLLRKMHRAALWGRIFHFLYWSIIIGLSIGAYYFIQPYVDQVKGVYTGVQSDVSNVKSMANQLGDFGKLIQGMRK